MRETAEGAPSVLGRLALAIFLSMNVMMFSMALWTGEMHTPSEQDHLAPALANVLRYLCLLATLPVLWLLGEPLAHNALFSRQRQTLATDGLILSGVIAAFVYSAVSVYRGSGHIYFEVACVVLVMVTLGRWFEAAGRAKSTESLQALEKLLPDKVRLTRSGDLTTFEWQALAEVRVGDQLVVLPGERVPADGTIAWGDSFIDEHLLTGESEPLARGMGDHILGGALNIDGAIVVRVGTPPSEGAWSRALASVREALARGGGYQRLAERASRWLFPAVLLVATGAFVMRGMGGDWGGGLMSALAVLLIACPCALGVATPMATCAAVGQALRRNVLIRGGDALERLAEARCVLFDKTGTLTTGDLRFVSAQYANAASKPRAHVIAASLAASSEHPLCLALAAALPRSDTARLRIDSMRATSGRGISALLDEAEGQVQLGSAAWMRSLGVEIEPSLQEAILDADANGLIHTILAWDQRAQAVFRFKEDLRPEAERAIEECQSLGCHVEALSGDRAARASALARRLGIRVTGELLPEDKLVALERAQLTFGSVAMVGDGINDSPALARADVGIALARGADLARETAQVCLLTNNLLEIPWAIQHARRAARIIRQNLFWAFFYNIVGVALAVAGWLTPAWAAFAMVASSALVTANSLRLNRDDQVEAALPRERQAPASSAAKELAKGVAA